MGKVKLGFKGRGIYGLRSINYKIADIKLLVKIIFGCCMRKES